MKNTKSGKNWMVVKLTLISKNNKTVEIYTAKSAGFVADFGKVDYSLENVNLPKFDTSHIF